MIKEPGTFKLLGNNERMKILKLLKERKRNVTEIVKELHIKQPLVSYHLTKMRKAGLIKSERNGKSNIYTIENQDLLEVV